MRIPLYVLDSVSLKIGDPQNLLCTKNTGKLSAYAKIAVVLLFSLCNQVPFRIHFCGMQDVSVNIQDNQTAVDSMGTLVFPF
jgi:hypothetical protein